MSRQMMGRSRRALTWIVMAVGMTSLPAADDVVEAPRPPQPVPAFPQPVPFVPQPVPFAPERPFAAPVRPRGPSLGISVAPLPPAVRAQVDVPDGVGLLVERVAEDGPAGEAGLQQFDLLVKFDDQLVCSPQQLDTLVRMAGGGAKASLTIRRGGRERVLEATIEERDDAWQQGHVMQGHVVPGGPWLALPPAGVIPGGVLPDAENLAEEIRRRVEEAIGAAQPGLVPAPGDVQPRPPLPPPPPLPPVRALPGAGRSQGMAVVSDESGTIELREQDGSLTVTIRDPGGTEIHSGGLDTEADREAVPEEFRDKVNAAAGRLRRRGQPPRVVPPPRPAADPALEEDRKKPDPDAI